MKKIFFLATAAMMSAAMYADLQVADFENIELAEESEYPEEYFATHRDSAAMRLANRFMRMSYVVTLNGNANDKLEWAVAVNAALDTFHLAVPAIPRDSAINEITNVISRFSSLSQFEMNAASYVDASVEYYRTNYGSLCSNRREALEQERDVILGGKPYKQHGLSHNTLCSMLPSTFGSWVLLL